MGRGAKRSVPPRIAFPARIIALDTCPKAPMKRSVGEGPVRPEGRRLPLGAAAEGEAPYACQAFPYRMGRSRDAGGPQVPRA